MGSAFQSQNWNDPKLGASNVMRSSTDANQMDFFGEGTAAAPAAAPPAAPVDPAAANQWASDNKKAKARDITTSSDASQAINNDPILRQRAFESGNIGGASGAYNTVSDAGRDAFDYYRDIRDPTSVGDFVNAMGERVGLSHAGDAMGLGDGLLGGFRVSNPLDFNPLQNVLDPETGLGVTADGRGGQPIGASMDPGLREAMTQGVGDMALGAAGDALDNLMGGLGSDYGKFDTSGSDRGGMGSYAADFDRHRGLADSARGLGADVLSGKTAGPNAADAQRQNDVMGQVGAFSPEASARAAKSAANFAAGPKAASDVLSDVTAFAQGPEGPSSASLLQDEASQKAMADVLSVSRSGRARDAGSQARAANMAQAEIAGMGVDNARNAALLRNKEANDARSQQLQALGLSGDLAQGLDTTKLGALSLQGDLAKSRDANALQALGIQGDLATQMRGQGITERGQGLDFMQGQQQIGAGLESDVLKTIPQLEQIRHDDQFDLTPQQKLAAAKLGGPPDKTTTDYVVGLLGDVLGVL
jgi:hypothetical protein